jgi:prolipoprotein diacylglyceryltransferase
VYVFGCRSPEDAESDSTKDNENGTKGANKGRNGRIVAVAVGMSLVGGVALVLVAVAVFRRKRRSQAAKEYDAAVREDVNLFVRL